MQMEKGLCLLKLCRTKNIVTLYRYDFTTIGTRELVFNISLMVFVESPHLYRDALMEECVRMMQQSMRASPPIKKRAKSVYNQRNLGTIKERKKEKKEQKELSDGETIMRILRMRCEFLFVCLDDTSLNMRPQAQHFRFHCATAANHDCNAGRARAAGAAE
jgi:hypothetical protein